MTGQDYLDLKNQLYDEGHQKTRPTDKDTTVNSRSFDIQIQLPSGPKSIPLSWLDTPGEIWRKSWQQEKPDEWQKFLNNLKQSEGILLILPPYRELIRFGAKPEEFMTKEQWLKRFDQWTEFFYTDCKKVRHLLLCFNKADLFCDVAKEGKHLRYEPRGAVMNWQQRDTYVRRRYFSAVDDKIQSLARGLSGGTVRCFVTSIYDRYLLELPWIYLGTFLASN